MDENVLHDVQGGVTNAYTYIYSSPQCATLDSTACTEHRIHVFIHSVSLFSSLKMLHIRSGRCLDAMRSRFARNIQTLIYHSRNNNNNKKSDAKAKLTNSNKLETIYRMVHT